MLVDDGDFASKRISVRGGGAGGDARRAVGEGDQPNETVGDGAFADTSATRAACRGAVALHPTADRYRRAGVLHHTDIFRCECAERMSETATLESIVRRLDGLQNNVSGLNRRMITLESNLSDRVAALEARMAGLEDRADELVNRIGALATGLNSLVVPTDYAIRTY